MSDVKNILCRECTLFSEEVKAYMLFVCLAGKSIVCCGGMKCDIVCCGGMKCDSDAVATK